MPEEELTARIDHALSKDQAATLLADPLATLRPSQGRLDTAEERALETLLELFENQRSGGAYETFEQHLGSGAMGVVRVATQPGIRRKVAVKTLKLAYRDRASTLRLLQEAWITGSLEHPNICPVYEIALDKAKSPQVVLKKIDGLHWRDLLDDRPHLERFLGETDLLEWNLRTLMKVASAAHFAHSRGIVHRDIKPENVMIGPFGDVYLMDWGIAVSTRDEDEGRIPLAWEVREMAGTPGYMAPEMLDGDEPFVSALTDVYLLGANLYEIICGRAPHRGESLMALVRSIVRSQPYFPAEAPPPLVAIASRAMAPNPADRYQSAEEFRLALQDFLRRRGSSRLCYEASVKLTSFEAHLLAFASDLSPELVAELDEAVTESPTIDASMWASTTFDAPAPGAKRDRGKLYDLFGACRFGFQQALEEGPDNKVAQDGLERVITLMAQFELSQGNLSAAELLALELKRPPKILRRLIRQHQEEEERRLSAMQRLQREHDPEVGTRTRATLAGILGVAWTVAPFIGEALATTRLGVLGTASLGTVIFLLFGGGLAIWTRSTMTASVLNRSLLGTIFVTLGGQLVVNLGVYLADAPATYAQLFWYVLWFMATAMIAVVLDRRLWPAALGYLAGFIVASAWPDGIYRVTSLCNLVFAINGFVIWWPREAKKAAADLGPGPQDTRPMPRVGRS